MKIVEFSRPPPPPPCPFTSKILPRLFSWKSNFRRPPPFQITTNQLEQKMVGSDFVFNINLLILLGFLLTSFHLAEASLLFSFSWFSTLVYTVIQKYHEMSFIYAYTHFSTHFAINLFYLQELENVNKPWNNNRTEHVIKRNKSKNKTKSRHIQIDHAFYCSI